MYKIWEETRWVCAEVGSTQVDLGKKPFCEWLTQSLLQTLLINK